MKNYVNYLRKIKLKYKDIVYAVSKNANERYFRVPTSEGGYFFYFDSFNELKEAIEKISYKIPKIVLNVFINLFIYINGILFNIID